MNTSRPGNGVALAVACAGALTFASAHADIYTWVDAAGKLNLSNQPPPDGVRVTNVYREDAAARAHSDSARAATAREELRTLNERVAELERALAKAKEAQARPPEPAPVTYAPAAPPPVPYATAMAQMVVAPPAPSYAPYLDCRDLWGGCFWPGSFGFYPSGVVVVNNPVPGHVHPPRRDGGRKPQSPPRVPRPVGELPDPPNLFPGTGR